MVFLEIFLLYLKRLYWLSTMVGLTYMFLRSTRILIQSFLFNPLTFSIDTAYLHWNTTFPAISVCQVLNDETMGEILESEIGPNRDYKLDNFMSDIAFYGGTCYSCEDCANGNLNCPKNFSSVVERYRLGCSALISDCSWLDVPFECCQFFHPLETEFGRCFSINSQNSNPKAKEKLVINRRTGPGVLRFKVKEDLQVYLHDEHAVPYAYIDRALKETILWGMSKEIIVRITEMENNDNVRDIAISRRDCRFPSEIPEWSSQLYSSYSFTSCAVECFMKTQIEFCNCSHHLMPQPRRASHSYQICSFDGLSCLTEKSAEIARKRKQCHCLSSCVEPEYSVIYSSDSELESVDDSSDDLVTIRMLSLPVDRFLRNTVKTELDLFISLGGLMGLFFGISLLTVFYGLAVAVRYGTSPRGGRGQQTTTTTVTTIVASS